MEITKEFLDGLTEQAKQSPRLRISYDLRNVPNDNSQRVLNALEPGTEVAIHRHLASSETTALIRGSLLMRIYNDDGTEKESFVVGAKGPVSFYVLAKGTWHTCDVLESGTIMFEAKDGKYEPVSPNDIMIIK